MAYKELTHDQLLLENEKLRSRLNEAEEALSAIRNGEVDSTIASGTGGDKVFSLASAEVPYRLLLEKMDEGVLNIGADGTIHYCNKRFSRLISQPTEKIIGTNCREFIAAGDIARFDKLIKSGLKENSDDIISFSKNDSLSIIYLKLSVKALPKGIAGDLSVVAADVSNLKKQQEKLEILVNKRTSEIQRLNGILQKKITEIKELKYALRESENKYSSVYSSMSEGFSIHELLFDDSGKATDYIITDVNPAYEQIIGVKKKNAVGRKASEVYKVSSAPYLDIYSNVALSGESQTFETYFPPMGKHFHVSVFSPGKGKFATVFQDISERKRSEEKLRLTLNRFYLVLSKMRNGILLLTSENRVEFVNQPFCEIFDLKESPEELLNLTADKVISLIRDKFLEPDKEIDHIKEIVEKQVPVSGEDITMKSGRTYIRDFTPIYIDENNYGRLWSHVDITDRKESEKILNNTFQRFYLMLSGMFTGVLLLTDEGKVELVNQAFCNYYYLKESPIDLIGITSAELLRKIKPGFRDPDLAEKRIREILSNGEFVRNEEIVMRNGETAVRDFVPLKINGVSIGRFWIHFDITERKKAEKELSDTKNYLNNLINYANAPIIVWNTQSEIQLFNKAFEHLTGYSSFEVIGKKLDLLFPDTSLTESNEKIRLALTQHWETIEIPILCKNKEVRIVIWNSANIYDSDNKTLVSTIAQGTDITERKNSEEALRNSEAKFSNAFRNSPNAITITRLSDGKIIEGNDSVYSLLGYSGEDVVGKTTLEMGIWTEMADRERLTRALSTNGSVQNEDFVLRKKDGTHVPVNLSASIIEINNEKCFLCSFIDLTERKKAETALRISEERLRVTLTSIGDAVMTFDTACRVIFLNPVAVKLTGWKPEEAAGQPVENIFRLINELTQVPAENIVAKVLQEGKVVGLSNHTSLIAKNGNKIPIEDSAAPIKDPFGNVIGVILVFHDVTEKRKAHEALKESEERFRNLVKNAPAAIYEMDFTTRKFTNVNDSMCILSGYTRDELLSIDSLELLDDDSKNIFLSRIRKSLKGEKPEENVEYRVKAKDGRMIDAVLNMKFNFNEKGVPTGAMVVGHDITQRKQAERELIEAGEALKESEKRFRNLAENTPDMILRFDKDLNLLYGNEALLIQTGLPINFLEGKKPTEYSSGYESAKKWEEAARKVINTGNILRIEQVSIWKGNSLVYDILIVPEKDETGKVNSIISIARDVTEMKKAENVLRVSEQRLKYHFENSPLAIVEWDRDFDIIRWSNEAERIFGLTRDEVIGVRIDMLNLIYPEDIPLVAKTMKRLTSGKELKVVSQNRNLTKSGEILECIWYNSVLMDEKGDVSSVMSLVEDVTLLRQTEKKLMESRESYKELVTNARSMILKFDNEGRFTFINEFALNFFGYKEEELLGESVMIIVPDIESTGRDLNEMVNNIKEDPDTYSINVNENIKKNGEIVWVEWRNKTLFDESGRKTGQISIGIDISERKKAEEALRDSENKLRSVLNAARESIYMFDKDFSVLMANATGLSRLGKTEEHEVIGHHFSEFMNAKLANERKEKLRSVFSNGLPVESIDVRASRTYHHRFYPVYKDNKVQFVVSYSTDITERKKAEQALLQSEDRFRTIAESLTVMIAINRIKDLKLSFLNEPFEKAFGYKKSDLLEKRLPDIFYYPGDAKFISDIFKVKGFVENMEIKVKKKDGTAFWIMTSLRKISFMNEPSYLTSSIDISENKKAQEELIRLNRTLDARSKSSQAMMHNSDEKEYLDNVCEIIIKDCGHAMAWVGYAQNDKRKTVKPVAYFGFDQGYIDQMNITWDESPNGSGPTGIAIRTGRPSICRNMLTDPSFRPWREAAIRRGYASSIVLPLKSEGKTFGALTIYSKDPDPFTDAEVDLLTKLADDLAYGIEFIRLTEYEKEAARAIQENEIRLKELVTTKDKFFNIIAHDLKNPFTSLLGASELLYDNIRQMTPENIKDLALILNDSSKSGYAILQNLLDWSRSQTGQLKFNPEKVNLKTIINENIENLQLQVNNKEIKLTSDLEEDLFITADKNMINTVLRNLLSNAVKYTFKNGFIRVIVSRENGEIKLTVKDTGVGMSKKKVDSLFRLENALSLPGTAKEQGTGIGLKLCKEFTERMGGKIWVDSKVGVGSEFRFSIPES
jgi:PAS domain S-box-containing protein